MFDVEKIRNDFPMIRNHPDIIYFDSAATAYKPQAVIDAVMDFYNYRTVNVHRGDYPLSFEASKLYEDTRTVMKKFINARSEKEIVFTYGATSGLNIVAYSYGHENLKEGDVVLTSYLEHASDILPWFKACDKTGAKIEHVPLTEDGHLTVENFEKAMHAGVKVVALTFVSNVLGYEVPVKEICRIAHSYGAVVAIDGAQAVPHAIVDVQDLDVDFLAFSSHKMCGPSGAGVLYGKYELLEKMDSLLFGGGANARFDKEGNIILKEAPYKFEAGTPNIEGTIGMKAAAEYLMNIGMENIVAYDRELQRYFSEKMQQLDNIDYYNPKADVGLVTFNVKGIFAQDAAAYLAANNIDVRSGNHCAKILWNTIGATETLRASLYLYNTKAEIDRFVEVLKDITLEKCVGVYL